MRSPATGGVQRSEFLIISRNGSRILASVSALALVPLLAACIGGGGGAQGPAPVEVPVESSTPAVQTTGEPCPDDLSQYVDAASPDGLVVTEIDAATFSGPVGHEDILAGLPQSCVIRLTGPVNYSYFYGEDETLVAELVKRLEAAGFTPAGGNTEAGGYWVDENGTVAAIAYSPDGHDTLVPGADDDPPLVGAGTDQPWVAVAFL